MPLTAEERQAYYNSIETSGIDSNLARATLRARIENVDAVGGITRDQFHGEMRKALEKAKVDTVVTSKWDTSVTAALAGRLAGDPANIDVGLLETRITRGIYPDIKEGVLTATRDKLADKHIEHFLNNSTDTSQQYIDRIRAGAGAGFTQDLGDRIVARTQQYIERKVQGIKIQLDAGTLTEAQVRAMITPPGGSINNPQLQAAVRKFIDDPARVQAGKEAADKVTIDADAANYKTELDATGIDNDFEVDFDDLTTRITTLPEYASLSGPARALVEAHMTNKNQQIENKREQADLKDNVNDATVAEKAVERNVRALQLVLRRAQWLVLGAVAGGSVAALLNASAFTIGLSGLLAGAGGLGLATAFDTNLATRAKELAESQQKVLTQQNERITLMSQRHAQEGETVKTFTKIAALVEALTKGVDKDKAVESYLKTASVDALDELLKT